MRTPASDRIASGVAALGAQGLLWAALLLGLAAGHAPSKIADALKTFDVTPPPPVPEPKVPQPRLAPHQSGHAAPPAKQAKPTEVVVPPPLTKVTPPPPIVAAPVAGQGAEARAGASSAGTGTGAGGQGNGLGAGGDGDGSGGGGEPPRHIRGEISDADYPPALWKAGVSGAVGVRYAVETNGRTGGCSITKSSGNGQLDAATCALIEKRFRYSPALDEDGRPVRSTIVETHEWVIDDEELRRRASRGRGDEN